MVLAANPHRNHANSCMQFTLGNLEVTRDELMRAPNEPFERRRPPHAGASTSRQHG
eukprot:COSAG01_NODE_56698_length_316_cov_2.299539_1_plen_55_part_10